MPPRHPTNVWLLTLAVAMPAFAGIDEDWASLSVDAGTPAPSRPPLPAPQKATPPAKTPAPPPAPVNPRWYPFTASAGFIVVTAQSTAVAAEVSAGPTFGRPPPSAKGTFLEGWFVTPLVEASYGGWGSRSVCLNTSLCASRFTLGGGARVGWGRGVPALSTGKAHVSTALFTQLSVSGAALSVPSAPLAPAITWSELVVRGRLGVTASLSGTPWVPSKSAFSIQLALVVEGVPASRLSRGATVGASLGVTF